MVGSLKKCKNGRDFAISLLKSMDFSVDDLDSALDSFEEKLSSLEDKSSKKEGK